MCIFSILLLIFSLDSSTNGTNVYMDSSGNLVIETKDNEPDERVQIEIFTGGTIYTDTLGVD